MRHLESVIAPLVEAEAGRCLRPVTLPSEGQIWLSAFNLQDFDSMLTVAGLEHGQFAILSNEFGLEPVKSFAFVDQFTRLGTPALLLRELVTQKRTLLVRRVQKKHPGIRAAYQAYNRRGFGVDDVVAILSPPNCQPTVPHADGHAILQLHLAGHKRWTYWDVVQDDLIDNAPSTAALQRTFHDLSVEKSGKSLTLRPGDMLFLPKRTLHTAVNGPEWSLSVSFQLSPLWGMGQLTTGRDLDTTDVFGEVGLSDS